MNSPGLQQLISGMGDSERGPRALPADCYRDPEFYALELERILRPGWHAVARFDDCPEPGDYESLDLCGEALLIVRDQGARLRVFSRVCRHRAHTIVEGAGNTRRFVCPYHRWSYGLDGALVNAPLMEGAPHFRAQDCGLPELHTEEWMGFVFVSLDDDARPLSAELSALEARVKPLGLGAMKTVGVLEFDSPWNWKVMIDNFMESYHHLGPHAQTLQKTNHAGDTFPTELGGPCAFLENPGHDGAPDFFAAHVFPTLLFAVFDGVQVGSWYEMRIDRHDHFQLRIHMLAAAELAKSEETVALIRDQSLKVHLEDIPVCEGVQRGLQSRLWRPGPLSPFEGALTRFHRYLATELTA